MSTAAMVSRLSVFFKQSFKPQKITRAWNFNQQCSSVARTEKNTDNTFERVSDDSLFDITERKTDDNTLQIVQEDLSHITPNFHQSFNIAAYVNRSETLQNLVNLNVNLSKIEKKPYIVEKFLRLDFERDMKDHIIFLNDYVDMEQIGDYITKNPMIFYEDLEDLKVRINYLNAKGFDGTQINRIISKNPFWLMYSTLRIDRRLGYFQECFDLTGKEVRYLTTRKPTLITYNLYHIKTNMFTIKEEMGFNPNEIKTMLMNKPKIWMLTQRALLERFNYVHNIMKISHKTIANNPEVLLSRLHRFKQRHLFLEKLGRAQYDPKKENYIPITALIKDTDVEFCNNYAKCIVDDFNTFLKTL